MRSGSPPKLQPGTARDWGGLTGPESQGFLEPAKTRMGENGVPKGIVPFVWYSGGAKTLLEGSGVPSRDSPRSPDAPEVGKTRSLSR